MCPARVIFGCEGKRVAPNEAAFFASADPFGFILFARNVEDPAQLERLTGDLRAAVGRDVPVLVDQEGGRVQRLTPPHWRAWPPPLDQCQTATDPGRAMWLRGRVIAAELLAVGIDVCCTPTADLAWPETHPFLRNRLMGDDAATVTANARALADGLLAGGVLPVVKHMPGHGRASVDSHGEVPRVHAPLAELERTDFAPFRALADLPMGMTGHMLIEALDAEAPVTLSPAGIALIRERIGFDGLLMSDDLSMEALSGAIEERAEGCLAAGCDVALHCNGKLDEMERVAARVPPLADVSLARANRALAARLAPEPIDIPAALAEFEALMTPKGP